MIYAELRYDFKRKLFILTASNYNDNFKFLIDFNNVSWRRKYMKSFW